MGFLFKAGRIYGVCITWYDVLNCCFFADGNYKYRQNMAETSSFSSFQYHETFLITL